MFEGFVSIFRQNQNLSDIQYENVKSDPRFSLLCTARSYNTSLAQKAKIIKYERKTELKQI